MTAATTTGPGRQSEVGAEPGPLVRLAEGRAAPRLVVSLLVLVLALPNLIRGPELLADDFVWLRNARFGGWLAAGGPRTYSRPASMLGADLTFGLIGPHPLAIYVVQIGLWLLAALAVLGLLQRLLTRQLALVVTLVWLVVPNHTSLEYWLSSLLAWASVAVAAYGLSRIIDDSRRDHFPLAGILLVTLGMLFYEITAGVALAGVLVLPWLVTGRFHKRTAAYGVTAIAAATAWSLAWNSSYPGATATWLPFETVLTGTLSLGFAPWGQGGRLIALLLTAGVLVVLVQAWQRPRRLRTWPTRLVLSGAAVVALGVIPQVRLQTNFYGVYDRSSTIASIGVALLLVGLGLFLVRQVRAATARNVVAVGLVAVLLVVAVGIRAQIGARYHQQGRAAAAAVASLARRPARFPLLVRSPYVDEVWIYGLQDGWNASAALQARTGNRKAVVWVRGSDCVATGPPLDDPLATFGSRPALFRLPHCVVPPKHSP